MGLLLFVNGIYETVIGVLMIVFPRIVLPGANASGVAAIRTLGFASLGIAALSISLIGAVRQDTGFEAGLFGITVFHAGLTLGNWMGQVAGVVPVPATVIHGAFAAAFALSFLLLGRVRS
ncbi:MAG: hypothetical protein C4521_10210 [Actinobacteria bacterium]|nr:MAG: hypothetical protein C4521_10210 [Actinomycetota bacterium]